MTDLSVATATRLVVVAGAPRGRATDAIGAAVRPFLDEHGPVSGARSVVVVCGSVTMARKREGLVHDITTQLALGGRSVRIVAPPRLTGVVQRSVGGSGWTPRPLSSDAVRLDAVPVPTAMTEADALILVNRLPRPTDRTSPVIGVWSHYVPLKLRLGALASGPREGLAAEIALAFRPSLVVLAGEVRGVAVAVATVDQVAAELFGLAIGAIAREEPDPATAIGPWENPLVQRATELGIGVSLPSDIVVHTHWTGIDADGREVFENLLAGVTSALGIAGQSPDS